MNRSKNQMLCKALCLLFPLSISLSANGQHARIQGILVDEASTPIPYSTISLLTPDSAFVGGTISENDGSFVIDELDEGQFVLVTQHIEFAEFATGPFSLKSMEQKDFGTITLQKSSVEIEEVLVKGKRALIEVHPDKMVFNVAGSVNASGNNGLELLGKAPGVVIDPDNNIILQGKSGVRIFINGRPSHLSGSDLATMLQAMQSDNILAIELITNPSARYEAEGSAGIINIKLKNNVTLGYNGQLISNYSKGTHPRMDHGLTFNYGKNRLSANVSVTRFDNIFQQDFVDVTYQNDFKIEAGAYDVRERDGFNLAAGLDYSISDKHSLHFTGRGILTDADYTLNSRSDIAEENGPAVETLVAQTLTKYESKNFNYTFAYQWDVDADTRFSTDFNFGAFEHDSRIDQPNAYYDPDGEPREETNFAFEPLTTIDLWSFKSDFDKEFDNFSLAAGVKYSNVQTDNQFVVYNVVNGMDTLDLDASNDFSYREQIAAGYLTSSIDISEKWGLNAGVRVEHTRSDAVLESQLSNQDDNVKRRYTDVFPNISLVFKDGKKHEVSLGYGRRVSRPSYQDLNPFENRLSDLSIFKGNPFLNPKYISNFQLSYVFNQKLVVSNTFSITKGFFAKILSIDGDKGSVIIPRNMDRAINNGISISYPQEVTEWWDMSLYAGYTYALYQGEFDNTVIDFSQDIYNARLQNNLTLPWDIDMDISFNWNSPWIWRGTVTIDGYWRMNVGIRKAFWNDRLQLRFTGSDIFNTNSDYPYYAKYGGLEIDGVYSVDNHRFGAGLTLKFGNNRIKKKSRKSGLDEELGRIAE